MTHPPVSRIFDFKALWKISRQIYEIRGFKSQNIDGVGFRPRNRHWTIVKNKDARPPDARLQSKAESRKKAEGKGQNGRAGAFRFCPLPQAPLCPFTLLPLYFQNSKLGMATVKSRRNSYFKWNQELARKMTNFCS